ncbi:MAG: energy transducer TonB [bacterium]|nr:energy transducer TonB [bacterium]
MPSRTVASNRLPLLPAVLTLLIWVPAVAADTFVTSMPHGIELLTFDQLPAPATPLEDRVASHEAALAEMAAAARGDWVPGKHPAGFADIAVDLSSAYDPVDAIAAAHGLTWIAGSMERYERLGVSLLGAARQARFGQDPDLARDYLRAAGHAFELADRERLAAGAPRGEKDFLHRAMVRLEQVLVDDSEDPWSDAADLLTKQLRVTSTGPTSDWARRMLSDPSTYVGEEDVDLSAGVYVGGEVRKPHKIFAPQPPYTEVSRKARIQGVVIIQAVIDRHGSVAAVALLKGLPMGLGEEAMRTISTWLFEPATLNGEPIVVNYNLTASYRMR